MKKNSILSSLIVTAALVLSGCRTPTEVERPSVADDPKPTTITITGNDQMRFSPTEFTVPAGSDVELVFRNIGRMPKEAMGHNLAVLVQGANTNAFANAAMRHADNEYIPPEMENQVIATTKILGPGEEETITFTAPDETGDYPFVCSFPGHTPAGMVGTMRVVE